MLVNRRHFTGKRNRPSSAMPLRCSLVAVRRGRMVRGLREAKAAMFTWLSRYEHNIWTTPQRKWRHAKRTESGVIFTRRINCGYFL
ncbi:hypothetical protein KCP76_24560 [Salmonella enterica subsp. enterica serovar Weltevreden]|nr:hypothetical protein KCP76_24560 [Salmonella enterica subsp. enterica serovar Weltevreden]